MTTNLPEITPLEERAIRRFEHDREFYVRCHAKARQLEETQPEVELGTRLQDSMRELQAEDEAVHDEDSIVRGARYIGNDLLGIPYAIASIPEQEALKAAARRVLAAVENRQ